MSSNNTIGIIDAIEKAIEFGKTSKTNNTMGLDLSMFQSVPKEYLSGDSKSCQIIDNGHGGMDAAGQYLTNKDYGKFFNHYNFIFFEGTWNRLVALYTAKKLYENKLNYKLIVPEEEDVSLSQRCKRANIFADEHPKFHHFFHSIHGNAFGIQSAEGIEVYSSEGDTYSDYIATIFINQYKKHIGWTMREDWSDGDPDKEAKFTVLTNTSMPSILSELGFYTNYRQCLKMMQVETMETIATAICQAQIEYEKTLQNL